MLNHTSERFSKNRNQVISFVLIALSLLVGFFSTYGLYEDYLRNSDALSALESTAKDKQTTLDRLNELKKEIDSGTGGITADIGRYASEYREDAYISSLFSRFSGISINSVSFDGGEKLPSGLSLAKISVTMQVQNIAILSSYLEYLTNASSAKRYVIESVDFPFTLTETEPFTVSLQLGNYYL